MAASPICEVKNGPSPYAATTNGADVTAGATISIRLASTTDVNEWYLQPLGTDELSTLPTLTSVNPLTFLVSSVAAQPTFTFPNGQGRAIRFLSTVTGVGGPLQTTFCVYTLTQISRRVGAVGEQREGNTGFGWIVLLNPIIRQGAGALFYDDTLQSPATGANTIQGALDALKVGSNPLPALANTQYAFLMEDPAGTLIFQRATEDMILPGFSISAFSKSAPNGGTLTYRRGDTVMGITSNATYVGGPPTSANIANTFGGSSDVGDITPGSWVTNSPFASGSLGGSVKRSGSDLGPDPTMQSTITATKGVSRTASFTIVFTRDAYWGVGSAGFSSEADIEGLSNTVLSASKNRTLTLSPSNQKVYYAYPKQYGLATFTLNSFPAAFNAPSEVMVTNINGVTSTYYLYESSNLLTGSNLAFVVT